MKQNRVERRRTAAVAKRIKNRPGTGYKKRSAQSVKTERNWIKRIMLEMRDNDQVIDNVTSGVLDGYFK